MARWKPFVRKDSYMPNNKMTPLVIGNGYTTDWGANGQPPVWDTAIGNPVSFNALTPFPLKQLSVAFSPVQDLHGYDAPWPAGGGKNIILKIIEGANINPDGTVITDTEFDLCVAQVTNGETYTFSANASAVVNPNVAGYFSSEPDIGSTTTDGQRITGLTSTFTATQTAYIALRISKPSSNYQLEKGSAITSYVPFENICPISGWDGVTVWRTGKNLFDAESELGGRGAVEQSDGSWYFATLTTISPNTIIWECPSEYTGRVTINYSYKNVNGSGSQGGRFKWVYSDGTTAAIYANVTTEYAQIVNTSPSDKVVVGLAWDFGSSINSTWFKDVQVELGSTASEYTPYNGRSISISFGSTVYGGTLDVLTGVVTMTMGSITCNGAENWRYESTSQACYLQLDSMKKSLEYDGKILCDKLPTARNNTLMPAGDSITGYNDPNARYPNNNWLYVDIAGVTSASALKAWLAENPIQVCYELATPQTISLTPQEVNSLAGDNTMWTDANGDLTVEYRSN